MDLHRPAIDELVRANPDDPTGRCRRCAGSKTCSTVGSSRVRCRSRRFITRSKTRNGSRAISRPTSSWSTWARHGAGSTLCTSSATALFDKPPFGNCMAHGIVLGHDKQKLSKRLRNYPDPDEMFNVYGADAMRWFLLSSPGYARRGPRVERKGPGEAVRSVLNPLWNAWKFFATYANADGYQATWRTDATDVLDRYVLSKAGGLVDEVTARRWTITTCIGACGAVTAFLDALNNWYIRRSRDRFWSGFGAEPRSDDSQDGRLRHAFYRAAHRLPGRGAAVAHGVRDRVPGPDGGAQRPSR